MLSDTTPDPAAAAAAFEDAFSATIKREGGYVLHTVEGDRGGMTYAGISRRAHPDWVGWRLIDAGRLQDAALTGQVRELYRANYWNRVAGDALPPPIAADLFDFAVNAGPAVAVKLAQIVVGTEPDGAMGPKTIAALRFFPAEQFRAAYALAKIKRYAEIVTRDRSQGRFLLGWVNRTLGALVA